MLIPPPLSAMVTALPQALGPDVLPGWAWHGPWAVLAIGWAMVAALAGFPLLAAAKALAPPTEPPESWAEAMDRKVSAICVIAFALLGTLCGGLALAAWAGPGAGAVPGLAVAAAAFLFAAQVTAGQALRR
jgi:hypothetical protein